MNDEHDPDDQPDDTDPGQGAIRANLDRLRARGLGAALPPHLARLARPHRARPASADSTDPIEQARAARAERTT